MPVAIRCFSAPAWISTTKRANRSDMTGTAPAVAAGDASADPDPRWNNSSAATGNPSFSAGTIDRSPTRSAVRVEGAQSRTPVYCHARMAACSANSPGDALGALVEFESAARIRETYPNGVRLLHDGGAWNTLGGQPTDDSEMALALARSILNRAAYDPDSAAQAYAWWYESHPYDIGRTTRAAVSAASRAGLGAAEAARTVAWRHSQANGALMRVSPIGILGGGTDPGSAAEWAQQDALLTHPNMVASTRIEYTPKRWPSPFGRAPARSKSTGLRSNWPRRQARHCPS